MGSETGQQAESPIHFVVVGAFHLGRTPVTNAEYGPFIAAGRAAAPPWWRDPAFDSPRQPIVGVTWDEAALDKWLADPDSLVPGSDMSFRLDNAAERADIIAYLKQLPSK